MAAYGVKKCHRITEKDPLAMQEPVPYSAGPYVTKKGNGSIYLPKAILLFKSTHQGLI